MLIAIVFKLLDGALDNAETRKLIVSVCRKLWDAFTNDPKYDAQLEVNERTLATPDLTTEERQNVLKDISNSHPHT